MKGSLIFFQMLSLDVKAESGRVHYSWLFVKLPRSAPNGYKDVLTSEARLTGLQLTVIPFPALIALPDTLRANEEKRDPAGVTAFSKKARACHSCIGNVRCQQKTPDQTDKHQAACLKLPALR